MDRAAQEIDFDGKLSTLSDALSRARALATQSNAAFRSALHDPGRDLEALAATAEMAALRAGQVAGFARLLAHAAQGRAT